MHIAFNGWFWDQPNTGSGQYLRRLLASLRKIAPALKLTLVLPPGKSNPSDVPPDVEVVQTKGPGGKVGKVWFEQRIFPATVRRVQADIAHVPYWGPPLTSPARLITTVLDMIPVVLPQYSPGLTGRLYTALVSAAAPGSAHVLTISNAARDDIVKHLNIPAESITTTYLGVDEAFHPRLGVERDADVRRRYNLPDRYIFYLGGFDVRKQVDQLLLAYTYVVQGQGDEVPLVLAGKEPQWGAPLFPDLRKYAAELGIGDRVQWVGYVDEADKPSLYRMAGVSVFPSVYEGFGLPLVEAMACGTPTVGWDTPVSAEICGDGAYLVESARSMAGAILALLLQPSFRDAMVNQGLAQATRYSWRKTAQETLRVYEQVMTQG
ncbi:MAG: glycosyltransferase family 1 protein [bacterium]|nr:glycosyltransferase family 1 protein [bacterium]